MSKIPIVGRPVFPVNTQRNQRNGRSDTINNQNNDFDLDFDAQIASDKIGDKENNLGLPPAPSIKSGEENDIEDIASQIELGFDETSLAKVRHYYENSKRLKTLAEQVLEYLNYSTIAQEAATILSDLSLGNEIAAKRLVQSIEGQGNE